MSVGLLNSYVSPVNQNRMHVIGTVANFDQRAASPLDVAHQGTVFVALDARLHARFSGGTPVGEWIVSRRVNGDWPLDPWPNTGWRFSDEASARAAYQTMRQHVLSRLHGAQPHDDRSPARGLVDPSSAWGEAFYVQGQEALYLSCDRGTEAKVLTSITDRLESFEIAGSNGGEGAVYSTQTAPHLVAITTGQGGLIEHLLVAFTPANELQAVAAGLPGSDLDTEPFEIDVPSGILVLSWGRLDGRGWTAQAPGQDPAAIIAHQIGNTVARPLPTPWTTTPDAPHAWGLRVRPGRYIVGLRFLETAQGISGMAMSHTQAAPLWPDLVGESAAAAPPNLAAAAAASHAAAAQIAAGAGGDEDPLVFPGQRLARLSDYVRLMKGMQRGDMNGALQAAGMDMASYGAAAGAWGMRMSQDPVLMNKFTAMMAKP